jgi:hypothetical protein
LPTDNSMLDLVERPRAKLRDPVLLHYYAHLPAEISLRRWLPTADLSVAPRSGSTTSVDDSGKLRSQIGPSRRRPWHHAAGISGAGDLEPWLRPPVLDVQTSRGRGQSTRSLYSCTVQHGTIWSSPRAAHAGSSRTLYVSGSPG